MLFLIINGFQGVVQRPQEDIVYLVDSFDKIKDAKLEYLFTNMNAKIAVTEFYRDEKNFDKLDWEIIKSKIWRNDENKLNKQDLKQAEFLVRYHVPVNCIHAIQFM